MATRYTPAIDRVIVRYQDGLILKGHTTDFLPARDRFHLLGVDSCPGTPPREILLTDLKGVFFVRNLDGNPAHLKRNTFEPTNVDPGRRIRVLFKDGELLLGMSQSYRRGRPGFFVTPADQRSNNERCFVVTAATQEVSLL
jgi:hypothetical protein